MFHMFYTVLFHRLHYLTVYWTCSSLAVISNSAFIYFVPFSFLLLHSYICVLLGLSVQRNLLRVLNFLSTPHVLFCSYQFVFLHCIVRLFFNFHLSQYLPPLLVFNCLISVTDIHWSITSLKVFNASK